jgi:hypothetical protein
MSDLTPQQYRLEKVLRGDDASQVARKEASPADQQSLQQNDPPDSVELDRERRGVNMGTIANSKQVLRTEARWPEPNGNR